MYYKRVIIVSIFTCSLLLGQEQDGLEYSSLELDKMEWENFERLEDKLYKLAYIDADELKKKRKKFKSTITTAGEAVKFLKRGMKLEEVIKKIGYPTRTFGLTGGSGPASIQFYWDYKNLKYKKGGFLRIRLTLSKKQENAVVTHWWMKENRVSPTKSQLE